MVNVLAGSLGCYRSKYRLSTDSIYFIIVLVYKTSENTEMSSDLFLFCLTGTYKTKRYSVTKTWPQTHTQS